MNPDSGSGAAVWALVALIASLSGCATAPSGGSDAAPVRAEHDPLEPLNRSLYAINDAVDRVTLKPIARGYKAVVPEFARRGVTNFSRNLFTPRSAVNNFLQGKPGPGFSELGRFIINTTLGIGGLIDIATAQGMPVYDEDFGQTLAVWGWKDSRYLVMPIFGPYTARDFVGRGFYGYFHPVSYAIREHNNYWPLVADLISLRAELLPLQADIDAAADPYLLIRDVYLQNREFEIYDGDPPAPDYDALLEEY